MGRCQSRSGGRARPAQPRVTSVPGSRRAGLHVALDSAHALLDQIHAGREAEADVLLSFASIAAAKTGSRKDCHAGLVEQAIGQRFSTGEAESLTGTGNV